MHLIRVYHTEALFVKGSRAPWQDLQSSIVKIDVRKRTCRAFGLDAPPISRPFPREKGSAIVADLKS
jgi:hypothetical protein